MDYSKLKVDELRELLTERGLDAKGRKAELVSRLVAADNLAATSASGSAPAPVSTSASGSAPAPVSTEEASVPAISQAPEMVDTDTQDISTLTESQRLALRREKFGIFSMDDESDKKLQRAKRFSILTAETEAAKLQQRAARFGVANGDTSSGRIAPLVVDADEMERREQRAGRFGILPPVDDQRRKQARAERFGLSTPATLSVSSCLGADSWEAKLAARQLRFGR